MLVVENDGSARLMLKAAAQSSLYIQITDQLLKHNEPVE